MKLRIKALRSLRWNYTWKGVWIWLKGRKRCRACSGSGRDRRRPSHLCYVCLGKPKRGYQRILSEPQRVIDEQTAVAEGVFV